MSNRGSAVSRGSLRRLAALAVAFSVGGFVVAPGAAASCAEMLRMRKAIAEARAVFVGTVIELENSNRWATVEVAEVWKGDVDDVVEVRGGPKDPPGPMSVASSVDRDYRLDETYVFVVSQGAGAVFRDNICTATTEFRSDLERFRPASAESPSPRSTGATPSDGTSADWLFGAVAAAALAVIIGVPLWMRRKGASGDPISARTRSDEDDRSRDNDP